MRPHSVRAHLLLVILVVASAVVAHSQLKPIANAQTVIHVPGDATTIQKAIYMAPRDARIEVAANVYHENLDVNQTVQLVGADKFATVIDGSYDAPVVDISKNDVQISGFTIRNGGGFAGIDIAETTSGQQIFGNIIANNSIGIDSMAISNTITGNTFLNNSQKGISLLFSRSHSISGNTISRSAFGVYFQQTTSSSISNNNISATSFGIYLSMSSTGNTISGNNVQGRKVGIYIVSSDNSNVNHNKATNSGDGIDVYNSKGCTVTYNNAFNNSYGIRILSVTSGTNNVHNNKLERNDWGIELNSATGTTLTKNWITRNTWGMWIQTASSNVIHHNDFVQNGVQLYPGGSNTWSSGGQGNYWSDYTGQDNPPQDGVGDTMLPHQAVDGYPLMHQYTEHDITTISISAPSAPVYAGQVVNILVTVKNQGNLSASETFYVRAKRDNEIIGTQKVTSLPGGDSTAVPFNWNTTTATLYHDYVITAEVILVQDELNTDNNLLADGQVYVRMMGDINNDRTVNAFDLMLLGKAYGSTQGSGSWNPNCNMNGDNVINYLDLSLLVQNYGNSAL